MRWASRILTLLMALLWLPASAHCQIELVSGFEFLACGTGDHQEEQPVHDGAACKNDVCAELEGGLYKLEDAGQLALAPVLAPLYLQDCESQPACAEFERVPPETSPPDLTSAWQFLTRTAASPRAPSIG